MELEISDVVALILNYNSMDLTIKCVNNLKKLSNELKILVVDNCSTDSSTNLFRTTFGSNSNIFFLKTIENAGYAVGNNYGFEYIRKKWPEVEYVLVLNPDIVVRKIETIYKLRQLLKDNANYAIASSQIFFNEKWRGFKDFGWKLPEKKHLFWAGTYGGKLFIDDVNNRYEEITIKNNIAEVEVVSGCFFMAKIKDLEKVGYFDNRTFLYFEESILAKKLLNDGKKEVILMTDYVKHDHQKKDNDLINYRKRLYDRKCFYNSKMVYIKYYSNLKGISLVMCKLINNVDIRIKKFGYGIAAVIQKWVNI